MYKVSSEIYKETDFRPTLKDNGNIISKFSFNYPLDENGKIDTVVDKDGDLVVTRRQNDVIEIEHSESTSLNLVGLQVWRGALLLADYIFHNRNEISSKNILELGSGVGLTGIAAGIYSANNVVCTDVDIGGILNLIRSNIERNKHLTKANIQVLEYDFMQPTENYSKELLQIIDNSDIVFAADVIYDNELTNGFISVLDFIFERQRKSCRTKTIFIALEKRYVFTLTEYDSVAPMFDYFIKHTMCKSWQFEYIPLNFPQYFKYERVQQLVLIKLSSK